MIRTVIIYKEDNTIQGIELCFREYLPCRDGKLLYEYER